MTNKELEKKVVELKEMKIMKSEIEEEISRLENELINEMNNRHVNELQEGIHHLSYKKIVSSRFNSKSFKEYNKALYNRFLEKSEYMRFTVR